MGFGSGPDLCRPLPESFGIILKFLKMRCMCMNYLFQKIIPIYSYFMILKRKEKERKQNCFDLYSVTRIRNRLVNLLQTVPFVYLLRQRKTFFLLWKRIHYQLQLSKIIVFNHFGSERLTCTIENKKIKEIKKKRNIKENKRLLNLAIRYFQVKTDNTSKSLWLLLITALKGYH